VWLRVRTSKSLPNLTATTVAKISAHYRALLAPESGAVKCPSELAVRFGSKDDIAAPQSDVCIISESGHGAAE
jgi:hypothetical protein